MKIISKISKITPILALVVLMLSCSDDDVNTQQEFNIVETALASPNLSNLVAALQAADGNLVNVLSGEGPFTVLAPTNEAFATFLSDNGFASLSEVPTDVLSQILLNHVISGNVTSTDLISAGSGYANTSATGPGNNNLSLYFNTTNGVRFNGVSSVTNADIMATNGTIHIVDAVIGFLESKGFDRPAAQSTGAILLQQAKLDNVKIFELLDTLKSLDKLQLSVAVATVLNFNRQKISTLGFRVTNTNTPLEARNIMG